MNYSATKAFIFLIFIWTFNVVQCAPSYNPEDFNGNHLITQQSPPKSSRRVTIQSVLGRNKEQNGELDPQTQNDMRILSLFEHELNQIFSCYVRLSCPRTRSPKVIAECEEIRDWPLYHQVMRMAGIRRYPFQNYAPKLSPITSTSSTNTSNRSSNMNLDHVDIESETTTIRANRRQRRQRRMNHLEGSAIKQ